MNVSKTYGIEIEIHSSISRYELAQKVNEALLQAGSEHRCSSGYYHHSTDANNVTRWEIKSDGSINRAGFYINSHPYDAEIVSPVLTGDDGLKVLKIVCQVIAPYAKINRSCGLHVHHGIKRHELRQIAKNWLKCEKQFLEMLPASRRNNTYCKTWASFHPHDVSNYSTVQAWWNSQINDRYVTLNLESFWLRGTVEFRAHSGTFEYKKIVNWLIATQRFVDVQADLIPSSFEDLVSQLFHNTTTVVPSRPVGKLCFKDRSNIYEGGERVYLRYEAVVDGVHTHSGVILQYLTDPHTYLLYIADESNGVVIWEQDEVETRDVRDYRNTRRLRNLLGKKVREFSGLAAPADPRRAPQIQDVSTPSNLSIDLTRAAEWMLSRYHHFAAAA